MRCRPWLLWTLVGIPVAAGLVWLCVLAWQDAVGPRLTDYLERSRDRVAAERRTADYLRPGGGLLFELASGALRPGHPLADLTGRFPPDRVHPYPTFTRVLYRHHPDAWVEVWAEGGRVVQALCFHDPVGRHIEKDQWFCDVFFEMSAATNAARLTEVRADAAGAVRNARMAAGGPAGTFVP
jgi:hypothetical protein